MIELYMPNNGNTYSTIMYYSFIIKLCNIIYIVSIHYKCYKYYSINYIAPHDILLYSHDCYLRTAADAGTTDPDCNSSAAITAITVVNILILLVSITLLVIGGVLIVRRKRHPPTVQVANNIAQTSPTFEQDPGPGISFTEGPCAENLHYQHLHISKMDDEHLYAQARS